MTKESRIGIHFVFWLLAYVVLLSVFASSSEIQEIDYIYTAIFIFTLMIAVYINELIVRQKFLNEGKYILFVSFTIVNIVLTSKFNQAVFGNLIDYLLPGYYFISYYSYFDIQLFVIAFVGLGTLTGLSIEWFALQRLQKEKANAEFKALVNQVNPHFLFNALNVVYTLSLKDSKETSAAVIKLSDILRYVTYDASTPKVKLSSEATILRDYIDLQKYRVHPTTKIEFSEDITEDVSIAPMLFLPLVENAFKHGVHNETENAYVRMSLQSREDVVSFMISNNRSQAPAKTGIGLRNLKDRLDLLYPGKHSLTITETEKEFYVSMQLHDRGR